MFLQNLRTLEKWTFIFLTVGLQKIGGHSSFILLVIPVGRETIYLRSLFSCLSIRRCTELKFLRRLMEQVIVEEDKTRDKIKALTSFLRSSESALNCTPHKSRAHTHIQLGIYKEMHNDFRKYYYHRQPADGGVIFARL